MFITEFKSKMHTTTTDIKKHTIEQIYDGEIWISYSNDVEDSYLKDGTFLNGLSLRYRCYDPLNHQTTNKSTPQNAPEYTHTECDHMIVNNLVVKGFQYWTCTGRKWNQNLLKMETYE